MAGLSDNEYLDSIVTEVTADLPKIDASIKNLLTLYLGGGSGLTTLSQNNAMICARSLLKAIQSYEISPLESYTSQYPQTESQSASDRLTEICRYKVIFAFRQSCVQKGSKISQSFGKSYFFWSKSWEGIKAHALDIMLSQNIALEEAEHFLGKYETSIFSPTSEGSDADLIWADNFTAALRARQQKRAETVQTRLDDIVQAVVKNKESDENEDTD
jgi:hypothetical protein